LVINRDASAMFNLRHALISFSLISGNQARNICNIFRSEFTEAWIEEGLAWVRARPACGLAE
jgi:hypothetical protein